MAPARGERGQQGGQEQGGAKDGAAYGSLLRRIATARDKSSGVVKGFTRKPARRLNPFPRFRDILSTMTSTDELTLLRRVATKDRKAFEALYHLYYRRLFGYLLKLTRRAELVEEVLNDVMLAIWKGAASFDGRSRPSTWIFGIAYHKALKALARRPAGRWRATRKAAPSRSTATSPRAWRRGGSWRACWAGRSAPCRRSSGRSSS